MAHNAYIRGSIGAWATGTQVSQAEFWQMDQYVYGAINGDAGGTWAPAAAITLGGTAGLVLGAGNPLTVGGLLSANGGTNTNALNAVSVTVTGDTALGSSFSDSLTVASTATFNGPVVATSTVNLTGTATLGAASTVAVTLAGNNSIGSTPGASGKATTLTGDIISAENGGRIALSFLDCPDSNVTSGYRHRFVFSNVTAPRNLFLTIADPRPGTEFHVHNKGGGSFADVYIGGVFIYSVASATNAMFIRGDSNWYYVVY